MEVLRANEKRTFHGEEHRGCRNAYSSFLQLRPTKALLHDWCREHFFAALAG